MYGTIELTQTMLAKSTINATRKIQEIVRISGICDYESIERGAENGVVHQCVIRSGERSYPGSIRLYKPASKDERRFWISALGSYANPGEIMRIQIDKENDEATITVTFRLPDEFEPDLDEVVPDEPLAAEDEYRIPLEDRDDEGELKHYQMTFSEIMAGDIIYLMPRFQRQYTWDLSNFRPLWGDIDSIWRNEEPKQFLGPIITRIFIPRSGRDAGQTWVVDGQQRITTLFALNVAIGTVAQEAGFTDITNDVLGLLFITRGGDVNRPSVEPTVKDLTQFNEVLRELSLSKSDMILNQDFGDLTLLRNGYKKYLKKGVLERCRKPNGEISNDRLKYLFDIVNYRLLFIQIDVPKSLNVNKVFTRLNTEGKKLNTADLVRNLIFEKMIDHPEEASQLHRDRVLPMETRFEYMSGDQVKSKLADYYFPFALTLGEDKLTKANMFSKLSQRWKDVPAPEIVSEIQTLVDPFLALTLGPNEKLGPQNPILNYSSILERVDSLRHIAPGGTYPYLLPLLKSFIDDPEGTLDETTKCLDLIESFLVRRGFSGLQSAGFQTLFKSLWEECENTPNARLLAEKIGNRSGYDYPDDEQFSKSIRVSNIYNKTTLCRYVLNSVEKSMDSVRGHKDFIDLNYATSTSEHIIPIDHSHWEDEIENWEIPDGYDTIEEWLEKNKNCIGNLTILLPYENSELSNSPWAEKREYYNRQSKYKSTKKVGELDLINPQSITKRTDEFIEWALQRWPLYDVDNA